MYELEYITEKEMQQAKNAELNLGTVEETA